jgi:hypothetical protein
MMPYMFTLLASILIALLTGAAICSLPWKEAELAQAGAELSAMVQWFKHQLFSSLQAAHTAKRPLRQLS